MSTLGLGELLVESCPRCGGDMAVVDRGLPSSWARVGSVVENEFSVVDLIAYEDRAEFEVEAENPGRSFSRVLSKLQKNGFVGVLRKRGDCLKLQVFRSPRSARDKPHLNILLLLTTVITTFGFSYFLIFERSVPYAALFSSSLLAMLGAHEMGHKLAASRNRVEASLPYFIPAPTFLGTLGALIRLKGPIPNRNALVEIGASGPLLGFLVAVLLTSIGLMFSEPGGEPLIFTCPMLMVLQLLFYGRIPSGLEQSPLVFSGSVMMVITSLNLFPAGQLDGGHVARGLLSRESHYMITRAVGFLLLFSGFIFPGYPFWLWGLLIILIFNQPHGGVLDDISELSPFHKHLAFLTFAVFLLCFPIPWGG